MSALNEKDDKIYVEHREDGVTAEGLNYAATASKDQELYLANAIEASDAQKTQTFRNAVSMYKPAIVYSVIFSSGEHP